VKPVAHISRWLVVALVLLCCNACEQVPSGVLGSKKMGDLFADLQLAEAYIDTQGATYASDSAKLALRQSVFEQHGVTQEEYDTSLDWYAHNAHKLDDVYKRAYEQLEKKRDKLSNISKRKHEDNANERSALKDGQQDVWQDLRSYMLTPGMKNGFITFELPIAEHATKGDSYQLEFNVARRKGAVRAFLAADYSDGITMITGKMVGGKNTVINLQTDSARNPRRVYGAIYYDTEGGIMYLDSIRLIRTPLDSMQYNMRSLRIINPKATPADINTPATVATRDTSSVSPAAQQPHRPFPGNMNPRDRRNSNRNVQRAPAGTLQSLPPAVRNRLQKNPRPKPTKQ